MCGVEAVLASGTGNKAVVRTVRPPISSAQFGERTLALSPIDKGPFALRDAARITYPLGVESDRLL